MKSYEQGRMDTWERIDAIKRRLGLAGFFNEQKIKRYPKGHPKAGEFMPQQVAYSPNRRTAIAKKVFSLNLSPMETRIGADRFSLRFNVSEGSVGVVFLTNGSLDDPGDDISPKTKKAAAFWWRRSAIQAAQMMPDGVVLKADVYTEDGRGQDRLDFYKALGFAHSDPSENTVSAVIRKGRITPISAKEEEVSRKATIRAIKFGEGKPLPNLRERRRLENTAANESAYEAALERMRQRREEYGRSLEEDLANSRRETERIRSERISLEQEIERIRSERISLEQESDRGRSKKRR